MHTPINITVKLKLYTVLPAYNYRVGFLTLFLLRKTFCRKGYISRCQMPVGRICCTCVKYEALNLCGFCLSEKVLISLKLSLLGVGSTKEFKWMRFMKMGLHDQFFGM